MVARVCSERHGWRGRARTKVGPLIQAEGKPPVDTTLLTSRRGGAKRAARRPAELLPLVDATVATHGPDDVRRQELGGSRPSNTECGQLPGGDTASAAAMSGGEEVRPAPPSPGSSTENNRAIANGFRLSIDTGSPRPLARQEFEFDGARFTDAAPCTHCRSSPLVSGYHPTIRGFISSRIHAILGVLVHGQDSGREQQRAKIEELAVAQVRHSFPDPRPGARPLCRSHRLFGG